VAAASANSGNVAEVFVPGRTTDGTTTRAAGNLPIRST